MQTEDNVQTYNFKKPIRFSQDQMVTLQMVHKTFSRLASVALSAQLRSIVSIQVNSITQTIYHEFIKSIPNPTTFSVFSMKPFNGSAVLEISPPIVFSIIDRLFGGKGDALLINREISDIEMLSIEGIITKLLKNLKDSWSTLIDFKPEIENIETNPQFAPIVSPNDIVVLITFQVKINDTDGVLHICIPYTTLEPVLFLLQKEYQYTNPYKNKEDEISKTATSILQKSMIKPYIEYKIHAPELKISEINQWQKGKRIEISNFTRPKKSFETGLQENK